MMKIGFIIVGTESTKADVARLRKQLISFTGKSKSKNILIYEIKNREGREGYAQGVNKGIRKGLKDGVDIFFALNPDISFSNTSIKKILEAHGRFDIWGYRMIQQKQRYDGGVIDVNRLSGGLQLVHSKKRFIEVDFVSGSCFAFTRQVVKSVGLWDEKYGMYYEDVEYCTRARKKGFQVGIDSAIVYRHFERSQNSTGKDAQLAKSRLRFFLTHAGINQYLYELLRIPKTLYEYRHVLWASLVKRPFLFNFLSLNSSSLINKVLNFILFLILVRALSVHDYGVYNVVWIHIGLLMPLADFGTTSYGLIHKKIQDKETFSSFFWLRIILALLFVGVTLGLGYLFKFNTELMYLIYLCIPVMIANALSGSLLIRTSTLNKSYIASMFSVLFNVLLIAILGVTTSLYKDITLVFKVVGIGYALYILALVVTLLRLNSLIIPSYSATGWRVILRGSSMFVLLSFFAGLYFKADVYLLRFFKGESAVGVYSAGYKFLEALLFIASSYTIASTPILKQFVQKKSIDFINKVSRDSRLLFILSFASVLLINSFGEPLIMLMLRNSFSEAIPVLRTVLFALPFLLVSTVYMSALYLLDKVVWVTMLFIFQIAVNVFLNYIYIPQYSYMASAYITVFSEVLNAFIVVFLFRKAYENRS